MDEDNNHRSFCLCSAKPSPLSFRPVNICWFQFVNMNSENNININVCINYVRYETYSNKIG